MMDPASSGSRTCACGIAKGATDLQQTLDEIDFTKSACYAAMNGNLDRLKAILEKHPEQIESDGTGHEHVPVCTYGTGYSPIIYASRAGHVDIVAHLLSLGANPNRKTKAMGSTALHRAAFAGHEEIVSLLLQHHADPSMKDCDGLTARDKALEGGHESICKMIDMAMAQEQRKEADTC